MWQKYLCFTLVWPGLSKASSLSSVVHPQQCTFTYLQCLPYQQYSFSDIQLVPKHRFFTDISVSVAQIKKFKIRGAFFSNFASGRTFLTQSTGPQAPFFTDIWVSVAQIKKLKKTRCFFSSSYFASGRTLPTQSTGPKPNSTGPQALFFTDICH